MARIVAGFASSHSPLMSLAPEQWELRARDDLINPELVAPPEGRHLTYAQLLAQADPAIAAQINVETFRRRVTNLQRGLDKLAQLFGEVAPDAVVLLADDQDELFYFNNMPSICVYWGKTIKIVPRQVSNTTSESTRVTASAYGTVEEDYPVEGALGLHIIEHLMEADFDVAHSTYLNPESGGTIGPATWYLDFARQSPPRRQGISHSFAFPLKRWFAGRRVPIVPIFLNTCYPPNWISPRRAYALGKAVGDAVRSWDRQARVAIATSGGLSHFVVDEELDRLALKGLAQADARLLTSLPRARLQSAASEILNWVAVAAAMEPLPMEVLSYEPGYRTPAGTGCGCACGTWLS
jgi:hypothetical protein